MTWLNRLATQHTLTPEKLAQREVQETRLALYQAERHLLEAEMQVDYYRNLLAFLETVAIGGVENTIDRQRSLPLFPVPRPAQATPDVATLRGGA